MEEYTLYRPKPHGPASYVSCKRPGCSWSSTAVDDEALIARWGQHKWNGCPKERDEERVAREIRERREAIEARLEKEGWGRGVED